MNPKYKWLRILDQCNELKDNIDYRELPYWPDQSWQDFIPNGWNKSFGEKLVDELHDLLVKYDYDSRYRISGIKEEFGEIRWYDSGFPGYGYVEYLSWRNKYQELSRKTCIICGDTGEMKSDIPHINPYCQKHYEELLKNTNFEKVSVIDET